MGHHAGRHAAAGLLQDIFVPEITTAQIQCAACSSAAAVGDLREYAASMGAILRCPHCDGVLLRAVYTPGGRWVEMAGARYLKFQSREERSQPRRTSTE
jgi:hypothetical protein